jgi:hypothetical protein
MTLQFTPLCAMLNTWHPIILSFKVFAQKGFIVTWISWVKCISDRLTGAKTCRMCGLQGMSSPYVYPTSTNPCLTRAAGPRGLIALKIIWFHLWVLWYIVIITLSTQKHTWISWVKCMKEKVTYSEEWRTWVPGYPSSNEHFLCQNV